MCLKELSDQIKSTYFGEGSSYLLGYVDNTLRWELLECIHVSSAFSFFGVWPRHSTFIGKCLHLPLVSLLPALLFPLQFVLKQVSRLAAFLLWIIQTQTGLLPLEQFS